jgi:hypothetical protein
VAWKRLSAKCPKCERFGPKLILQRHYFRTRYLSIFLCQCERCEHVFECRRDGRKWAELRKKYHLTRREESLIRRQTWQPFIKAAVEGQLNSFLAGGAMARVGEGMDRLAWLAKVLRESNEGH